MARHPLFAGRRTGTVRLADLEGAAAPVTLALVSPGITCLLGPAPVGARLLGAAGRRARQLRLTVAAPEMGRGLPRGRSVAAVLDQALAGEAAGRRAVARPLLEAAFGLDGAAEAAPLNEDRALLLRLALAAAAMPDVLLVPELLATLRDAAVVREAAMALALCVLHATARRDTAMLLADQIVLLGEAGVLQIGTPAELYERPVSLAAALAAGPGTVLSGRIEDYEDDVAVVALTCGPVVEAMPPPGGGEGLAPRCACHVLLRPERVAVSTLAAGALSDQAVAGVLREVRHLGPVVRLEVAIGDGAVVEVLRPSFVPLLGLEPGRAVALAWQARHALVFAA